MATATFEPKRWAKFPHDNKPFNYDREGLIAQWDLLHRGDCEPLPTSERVLSLAPAQSNPEETADALLEAWRLYHVGAFSEAVLLADEIGVLAHAVANKASGIYADYVEDDETIQKAIYEHGMNRAADAINAFPSDPNAHYFHAFMTGRYSQCISVTKALKDGLATRVQSDIATVLELQAKHAEGYLALGLFHAEVIDKVGRMVGRVTYGASSDESLKAFQTALKLTPKSPIAWIEYGNALYLMFGDDRIQESNEAYETATQCKVIDAMTCLDVAYAKASLSDS